MKTTTSTVREETINLKITCNGTEQDIIAALKDLVESYEQYGVINSEDAWVLAEVE